MSEQSITFWDEDFCADHRNPKFRAERILSTLDALVESACFGQPDKAEACGRFNDAAGRFERWLLGYRLGPVPTATVAVRLRNLATMVAKIVE